MSLALGVDVVDVGVQRVILAADVAIGVNGQVVCDDVGLFVVVAGEDVAAHLEIDLVADDAVDGQILVVFDVDFLAHGGQFVHRDADGPVFAADVAAGGADVQLARDDVAAILVASGLNVAERVDGDVFALDGSQVHIAGAFDVHAVRGRVADGEIDRAGHIHAEGIVFRADGAARVYGEIAAGGDGIAALRRFERILRDLFQRVGERGEAIGLLLRLVGISLGDVDEVVDLVERFLTLGNGLSQVVDLFLLAFDLAGKGVELFLRGLGVVLQLLELILQIFEGFLGPGQFFLRRFEGFLGGLLVEVELQPLYVYLL